MLPLVVHQNSRYHVMVSRAPEGRGVNRLCHVERGVTHAAIDFFLIMVRRFAARGANRAASSGLIIAAGLRLCDVTANGVTAVHVAHAKRASLIQCVCPHC